MQTQTERVLSLLRKRGEQGISPVDFAAPNVVDGQKPIMRVAARIFDLRSDGVNIVERRDPNGLSRYVLVSVPESDSQPVSEPAPFASIVRGLFDSGGYRTADKRPWEDA